MRIALLQRIIIIAAVIVFPAGRHADAQSPGDALELFSYRAPSGARPNVYDGQIAPSTSPTDWKSAYVRVMNAAINGDSLNGAEQLVFLASNDADSLYVAAAIQLPNASTLNRLTIYFDQGMRGVLEGSPGRPGEYFVTMLADGNPPRDGNWNGSAWTANMTAAARGTGIRKGTSGAMRLYNFELALPLRKAGDSLDSYLDLAAGDKLGMILKVTDNNGNDYFWDQTNADVTGPSALGTNGRQGWAEIATTGSGIADRNLASLAANGILPVIDGNISGDNNWRYAFSKSIILTDFRGNTFSAALKLKEQSNPANLLIGLRLNGVVPNPADVLSVYFDQGSSGRSLNYILNDAGSSRLDPAARITGNGIFQNYYFDGSGWTPASTPPGSGAAGMVAGNWEAEMSIPMNSGDPQHLAVSSGDSLGFLLRYFDASHNSSYWWATTVNSNSLIIDPVSPVFNALSWGFLHTGGPFVQPIYPENGDTLGGAYPLALYAIDPNAPNPKLGIVSVTYELRKENPGVGTYSLLASGSLTKVVDDSIPIWTGVLDTRQIAQTPGSELSLTYFVDNGRIGPVPMPVTVYINNTAAAVINDPRITVSSPAADSSVSGDRVAVVFSAATNPLLSLDTIQVLVDGSVLQTYLPQSSSYSATYFWNTSLLPDGEHLIQVKGSNSLNLQTVSPALLVYTRNSPSVAFNAPMPSSLVRGTMALEFTAFPVAPNLLAAVDISIDGDRQWTGVATPPPAQGGAGSAQWNSSLVPDGTHTIRLRATDNTGKTALSAPLSLVVDNTPPTGTFGSSLAAAKNGDTLAFTFRGSEAGLRAVVPLGELQILDMQAASDLFLSDPSHSGFYTGTYVVQSGNTNADGTKVLAATVTDSAGNSFAPQLAIVLDNTPPSFRSVAATDPDTLYANGETVSLLAAFDHPGYRVECDFSPIDASFIRGSEVVADNGDGTYSIRYTISQSNTRPDGSHAISVRGRDEVGLTGGGTISLVLDNSGPVVSALSLADPDRILNTGTAVTATVTDPTSAVKGAEFSVDVILPPGEGMLFAPADGLFDSPGENVSGLLSIAGLAEGKHLLYARAEDAAGKWGPVAMLAFIVDTKPPDIQDVEVLYAAGDQAVARDGQVITVTAMVTDKTTSVDPAAVTLTAVDIDTGAHALPMFDDGTHGDKVAGDAVYSAEITVNSGRTGAALAYTISAEDIVPNRSTLQGLISLDNLPPQLSFAVSPLPKNGTGMSGEVYQNEVVLTGTYFDRPDSGTIRNITLDIKNAADDNVNTSPLILPPNAERRFSSVVKLVEGENTVTVTVTDLSGNYNRQVVSLTYLKPAETRMVGDQGGSVSSPDGATVVLPPGALLNPTEVTVNTVPTSQLPKPSNPSVRLLENAHRFGPEGTVFHRPVTITLPYTSAELDVNQDGVNDLQENTLDVFFWDGHDWIKTVADSRSPQSRTVSFSANHFSIYALGTDMSVVGFRIYWTRNPFSPAEGTTAVIQAPLPGYLTLRIYDMAGNLVRTLSDREAIAGSANRRWDGLNDFDSYVGSGIYVYVLEYEDNTGVKTVVKKPLGIVR